MRRTVSWALIALAACGTTGGEALRPEPGRTAVATPAPQPPPPTPEPASGALPEPAAEPSSGAGPAIPLDTATQCLAAAIYHEARAEAEEGQRAVAAVILNRAEDEGFPGDACAVIKQGGETPPCQFSWWCDGRADAAREEDAYEEALRVAEAMLAGAPDPTGGATYFHALGGEPPSWAAVFRRTAVIGAHVFYAED